MITASQLYDHIACPRRVDLDLHRDRSERAELSPFIQMLWRRGVAHESKLVAGLPSDCLVLARLPGDERSAATVAAMERGVAMIQGGRIEAGDLLGGPDLLIRRGSAYVAADMKSGRGLDGEDDDEGNGRPKAAYAVQVALYTDVLERLGRSGAGSQRSGTWMVGTSNTI